jgi:hypothetical protein
MRPNGTIFWSDVPPTHTYNQVLPAGPLYVVARGEARPGGRRD